MLELSVGHYVVMEQIASCVVDENAWMSVREDQVQLPDGTPGVYGVVDKPDFALTKRCVMSCSEGSRAGEPGVRSSARYTSNPWLQNGWLLSGSLAVTFLTCHLSAKWGGTGGGIVP